MNIVRVNNRSIIWEKISIVRRICVVILSHLLYGFLHLSGYHLSQNLYVLLQLLGCGGKVRQKLVFYIGVYGNIG